MNSFHGPVDNNQFSFASLYTEQGCWNLKSHFLHIAFQIAASPNFPQLPF